jgi:hypothetical protein
VGRSAPQANRPRSAGGSANVRALDRRCPACPRPSGRAGAPGPAHPTPGCAHPSLPICPAWFWSLGWLDVFRRVEIRRRETFDSSATPTVGQRPRTPGQLAPVDIERLRERIAATIEKAKAEDPRELRRRIAELEKQLASRAPAPKVEKVVERMEVPVIRDAQIAQLGQAVSRLSEVGMQLVATAQEVAAALAKVTAAPGPRQVTAAAVARPARANPAPPVATPTNGSASVAALQLRAGERRMLQVLAQHYPMQLLADLRALRDQRAPPPDL